MYRKSCQIIDIKNNIKNWLMKRKLFIDLKLKCVEQKILSRSRFFFQQERRNEFFTPGDYFICIFFFDYVFSLNFIPNFFVDNFVLWMKEGCTLLGKAVCWIHLQTRFVRSYIIGRPQSLSPVLGSQSCCWER